MCKSKINLEYLKYGGQNFKKIFQKNILLNKKHLDEGILD